jgi:hypothetical protein
MSRIAAEEDFSLLSNLSPRRTGLPFVVWISAQGGAEQDLCVKISRHAKVKSGELITVALHPEIRALGSAPFTAEELTLLTEWVGKNGAILLAYWNQEIDSADAISALQPVGGEPRNEKPH